MLTVSLFWRRTLLIEELPCFHHCGRNIPFLSGMCDICLRSWQKAELGMFCDNRHRLYLLENTNPSFPDPACPSSTFTMKRRDWPTWISIISPRHSYAPNVIHLRCFSMLFCWKKYGFDMAFSNKAWVC